MTRKIRWNNLALVVGISVFDIACGMYNRIVNDSGMIKSISEWYPAIAHQAATMPMSHTWNSTQVSLATTSQSGYGLMSVVLIVLAAIAIMGVLFTLVGARAA